MRRRSRAETWIALDQSILPPSVPTRRRLRSTLQRAASSQISKLSSLGFLITHRLHRDRHAGELGPRVSHRLRCRWAQYALQTRSAAGPTLPDHIGASVQSIYNWQECEARRCVPSTGRPSLLEEMGASVRERDSEDLEAPRAVHQTFFEAAMLIASMMQPNDIPSFAPYVPGSPLRRGMPS